MHIPNHVTNDFVALFQSKIFETDANRLISNIRPSIVKQKSDSCLGSLIATVVPALENKRKASTAVWDYGEWSEWFWEILATATTGHESAEKLESLESKVEDWQLIVDQLLSESHVSDVVQNRLWWRRKWYVSMMLVAVGVLIFMMIQWISMPGRTQVRWVGFGRGCMSSVSRLVANLCR
eukprot:TRINITY_DN25901_c0_g1_i1.p1 TRINITY_DN25901_c0_g1~~TRINITY_DN25901_c0_g1_i1.p1  ORF type:complete len:180 (+),score=26.53 TRINITY_DN25901_c0_g1_i1:80-619(+)